jgi:hypothetical protein
VIDRHKVPALLADHGVEDRRSDLFYTRPVFANRLRKGIKRFRKNALPAQENGVRPQACALFETVGGCRWMELAAEAAGAGEELGDECSATKSAENRGGLVLVVPGSGPEKPVASGWLSGGHK